MGKSKQPEKATNLPVTFDFLEGRAKGAEAAGYSKAKWITFCETMLTYGLTVVLYEARQTYSKYVTVKQGKDTYKVRFSNHKPIKARELKGDCDFFVGRTHLGITNTEQAIHATLVHFGLRAPDEVITDEIDTDIDDAAPAPWAERNGKPRWALG